jgi:hypothetical protein
VEQTVCDVRCLQEPHCEHRFSPYVAWRGGSCKQSYTSPRGVSQKCMSHTSCMQNCKPVFNQRFAGSGQNSLHAGYDANDVAALSGPKFGVLPTRPRNRQYRDRLPCGTAEFLYHRAHSFRHWCTTPQHLGPGFIMHPAQIDARDLLTIRRDRLDAQITFDAP